ncbi:MAG: thymidine phosphorylase, partial [Spirochaetales bacterium]|nr:thymidine phosphorylase [Spirochaetales bacterium]
MNIIEIIEKKKHKQPLTAGEIKFFIEGYTAKQIPDYQASALMMAIWFNGMENDEINYLTQAMVATGYKTKPAKIKEMLIDKHSTGGVSDSTTLIACCITASCGGKVAKASGRGLGFTGGTIDKLEAIPGFKTEIDEAIYLDLLVRNNFVLTSQSDKFVPADKALYALRDVTATVDSLPLIASSVMSKKLASGVDAIVLDVKCGNGAFMKNETEAKQLAEIMVDIGKKNNKKIVAIVSDMNQPLGKTIGNSLEIEEVIEVLTNQTTHSRLRTLSLELAAEMLYQAEIFP